MSTNVLFAHELSISFFFSFWFVFSDISRCAPMVQALCNVLPMAQDNISLIIDLVSFLAGLYESTGRAIAVTLALASALLKC